MASPAAIVNNTESVIGAIGASARLALEIGNNALPIIQFVAGFFPGAAPVAQVLGVALPILAKIGAGAPLVAQGVQDARPQIEQIIAAAQSIRPEVIDDLKQLYALAIAKDPALGTVHDSAEVTIQDLHGFLSNTFERSLFQPQDPRFDRSRFY